MWHDIQCWLGHHAWRDAPSYEDDFSLLYLCDHCGCGELRTRSGAHVRYLNPVQAEMRRQGCTHSSERT